MNTAHQTSSTSLAHYRTLDTSSQCAEILRYLRKISPESICIADLAKVLGWERSTVSGRFNELKHDGKLEYDGKKKSITTGITAKHWRVKTKETLF